MLRQFLLLVGMIAVVMVALLLSLYVLDVIRLAEMQKDMGKLLGVMGIAAGAGVVIMLLVKAAEKRLSMHKGVASWCLLVSLLAPAGFAMDSDGRPQLKLEPAPKEVQLRDGGFQVGPRTKIFVLLGHQSEDRIAAETLAEEVADQSGLKLDILGMKPAGKAEGGAIVLARLQDARVRRFLARNGLKADEMVGEDGYLLFSRQVAFDCGGQNRAGIVLWCADVAAVAASGGQGTDLSGGGNSRLAEPASSGVGEGDVPGARRVEADVSAYWTASKDALP